MKYYVVTEYQELGDQHGPYKNKDDAHAWARRLSGYVLSEKDLAEMLLQAKLHMMMKKAA